METKIKNLDLINGIYCLLSDNLNCIQSWAFFLFGPEFDDEPELRNRMGGIWICSLLDSLEGERRVLDVYRSTAEAEGLDHLVAATSQVGLFIDCVEEVLSLYNRAEQVFLSDYRDQTVHSWLARRHVPEFRIRYYAEGEIQREKVTKEDHASLVRPFYEAGNLSLTLHVLVQRFRNLELRYWHAIVEFIEGEKLKRWYHGLMEGEHFEFDSLTAGISGPVEMTFGPPRRRIRGNPDNTAP